MALTRRARFAACTLAVFGGLILVGGCGSSSTPDDPTGSRHETVSTGPLSHVHLLAATRNGLVLGDQEGLWRGNQNAKDWKPTGAPLNRMMVTCLAQLSGAELACTTTRARGFLGSPRGLWRSTDDGRRWRRTSLPDLSVIYIAANPDVPRVAVVFARPNGSNGGTGDGGIWDTTNSGRSWRRINSSLAATLQPIGLALLPGRPFTVIFADTGGLHISRDGGRTWRTDSLGNSIILALTTARFDTHIAFASGVTPGKNSAAIWQGTESGSVWRRRCTVSPTSVLTTGGTPVVYGYASAAKPFIYQATISRSGGAESHCSVLRNTAPSSGGQPVITVDPTNPNRVFAAWGFPLRIYRSDDGGRSWKQLL